jgi:hypothetical protein
MEYALLLLCLFHPLLVYYQLYTIHPVTLDVLLFAMLVFISLRWGREQTILNTLLLIFSIGFAVLERSTLIFALVPAILLSLNQWKYLFKLVLITTVSILVFLSPWVARNYELTEKIQMTSGTWRYLWVGIQEETDGTNVLNNGESYYALFPQEVQDNWSNKNLDEQLDFYKESYLETLDSNPVHIFKMWGVKLKNMFWFSSKVGMTSKMDGGVLVYKIGHFLLLLLFCIGLLVSKNKSLWVLMIGMVCFAIVQSFFYVETRHAMPFQFILWIGALFGIDYLFSRTFRIKS